MATGKDRRDEAEGACPFLVPVTADRMFMYPVGAFCRRPNHAVRVPAASTVMRMCGTPQYRTCPGVRAESLTFI
jgi:hypothetical protein